MGFEKNKDGKLLPSAKNMRNINYNIELELEAEKIARGCKDSAKYINNSYGILEGNQDNHFWDPNNIGKISL